MNFFQVELLQASGVFAAFVVFCVGYSVFSVGIFLLAVPRAADYCFPQGMWMLFALLACLLTESQDQKLSRSCHHCLGSEFSWVEHLTQRIDELAVATLPPRL